MSNKQIKVIDVYVKQLSFSNGLTTKEAKGLIVSLFDAINVDIKSGRKVRINNFGTFKLSTRSARTERKGRNPRTGEEVIIPAQPEKQVVSFKPTKVK
jgi:DNA-binding protein HU-beta